MSGDHACASRSASTSASGHEPSSTLGSASQTSSASQTRSRRGSQQPWPSPVTHMKPSGIDFGHLQTLSQDYDAFPQAAKQWLQSFKDIRPGTNVSSKLVATQQVDMTGVAGTSELSADVDSTQTLHQLDNFENLSVSSLRSAVGNYPSMLPILSRWLRMWFDRASVARYQKRKNQTDKAQQIFVPEDDNFAWICAYVTDYLALDHEGLAEVDLIVLIQTALQICLKSGAFVDFDRLLRLLQSVYSRYGCPPRVLEKSLYVLCCIRGSFRELPARFDECLKLVLSAQESSAAVQILHGLLRTGVERFEESNASITTNAARGVIQVLQSIIDTEPNLATSTEDLVDSLLSATALQSGRVNEAVLVLCVCQMEPDSPIVHGSDEQFQKFMDVVNAAYQTVRVPSPAAEEGLPSSARSSRDATYSGYGGPANVRDFVDSALQRLLQSLTGVKRSLVFSHFKLCAELLSFERSRRILDYAAKEMLNWKANEHRRDEPLQLLRTYAQNPEISSDIRLVAIRTTEHALWSPGLSWSHKDELSLGSPEGTTTLDIVQEFLEPIKTETDLPILEALVDIATRAVMTYDNRNFTEHICDDIADVVFRGSAWLEVAKTSEIGARGLVSIFMRSLNTNKVHRTDFAYRKLNQIASSFQVPAEARLAALRVLFRIRCDSKRRIYISQSSESEYLAAALCRTDESAAKFSQATESLDDQGASRSSGLNSRRTRPTPPLWIYPGVPALPLVPDIQPSEYIVAPGYDVTSGSGRQEFIELELKIWLESLIACLQKDPDWETYSYIIVHIGAQLSNVPLLEGRIRFIQFLRSVLCEQVQRTSFHEPPAATGLKKGDVALCVFNAMTPLIAYKAHFGKNECDALVRAFMVGIGSFEGTSRGCIHSLSICCFEIPASVTKNLSSIIRKIQTNATQSHLSMHFLEFFAGLARLPEVHTNLHGDEVRLIFGICIGYIKSMRDRRIQSPPGTGNESTSTRHSGGVVPPFRAKIVAAMELPQYVSALAYHTMVFWFLSLKLSERALHVPWIIKSLIFVDDDGHEQIEEQGEVFIDMMQRTAFSDLGETLPHPDFASDSDGTVSTASWLLGLSIVTVETAGNTGRSQITKRQASGTTHSIYRQSTADLPSHHAPLTTDPRPETTQALGMLPQHILLQLVTTCAPTGLVSQPLPLPNAEYVKRALRSFDLNPTVDGNKIGVVYVGPGQTKEREILANARGSPDFDHFLNGLGTKVKLEGAKFNVQGLRSDTDGEYTYAWRDRVTEVVYHVPSMMPTNLEDDPQCTNKKRHIGNDHVNIIFSRSGHAFDFHTFDSQFNYVNIVVTPASRLSDDEDSAPADPSTTAEHLSSPTSDTATTTSQNQHPQFYQVHTLTAPGFPPISPASDPKIISRQNLAGFIRLLALNASVFSLAWRDRASPTSDHISSWRTRLQEIRRLRDRVTNEAAAAAVASEPKRGGALYAGYGRSGRSGSLYPEGRGELMAERKIASGDGGGEAKGKEKDREKEHAGEERMAELYDFSRWTLQ